MKTGAVVSTTFTVLVATAVFPEESVAVVTVYVPTASESMSSEVETSIAPERSVAVAFPST